MTIFIPGSHLIRQRLPLAHEVLELHKVEHSVFIFVKFLETCLDLEVSCNLNWAEIFRMRPELD